MPSLACALVSAMGKLRSVATQQRTAVQEACFDSPVCGEERSARVAVEEPAEVPQWSTEVPADWYVLPGCLVEVDMPITPAIEAAFEILTAVAAEGERCSAGSARCRRPPGARHATTAWRARF
mmetsp:Transcript_34964/g.99460  ORF Transcript_34964/g.99460 Transcript_34964/m.99460 type:complete len:123 (-) Transcript_34964:470-838(-)